MSQGWPQVQGYTRSYPRGLQLSVQNFFNENFSLATMAPGPQYGKDLLFKTLLTLRSLSYRKRCGELTRAGLLLTLSLCTQCLLFQLGVSALSSLKENLTLSEFPQILDIHSLLSDYSPICSWDTDRAILCFPLNKSIHWYFSAQKSLSDAAPNPSQAGDLNSEHELACCYICTVSCPAEKGLNHCALGQTRYCTVDVREVSLPLGILGFLAQKQCISEVLLRISTCCFSVLQLWSSLAYATSIYLLHFKSLNELYLYFSKIGYY